MALMYSAVPQLFVVLVVAGVLALVALGATVLALHQAHVDLRYIRLLGVGNGRLASARGERVLAWLRLGQAVTASVVTGTMAWVALQVPPESFIPPVWVVIVAMVAAWSGLVAATALVWWLTRRRVDLLGLDLNGAGHE